MITDEGKRICDKEFWSHKRGIWCGCRKPATVSVKSEWMVSGLDYCEKHAPMEAVMTKDEYKKMLRDLDARVLPRREGESDSDYGNRMREYLNPSSIAAAA